MFRPKGRRKFILCCASFDETGVESIADQLCDMSDIFYLVAILAWFIVIRIVTLAPVWQPGPVSSLLSALWFFIFMCIGGGSWFSGAGRYCEVLFPW